jgi:hypothetical protein
VRGIFFFDDGEQRVRESVERGGIDAPGIADGIGDKGEMRPVDQRHAIEKKQSHAGMMDRILALVSSYRSDGACPNLIRIRFPSDDLAFIMRL